MKTSSTSVRKHLDGDVTALCTCWKIIRQDGKEFFFADSDSNLEIDGDTYLSVGAYSRTAIESTAALSVDNLDVEGITTPLMLPIEELRAGAFDHAEVYIFLTPWIAPSFGTVKLRKGFFGEVRVLPNGTFDVEIRGLLQKLAHNYMEVFSATCRNDLGDSRCTVDLYHPFNEDGTHIPIPLLDSDFEEMGAAGLARSFAWHDPTMSGDVLTTTSPTRGGTYAARGGPTGHLQQDVVLTTMGEEFMRHVHEGQLSVRLKSWRRDNGAEGNLAIRFFDAYHRNARRPQYYSAGPSPMGLPSALTLTGDFTVEFWVRTNGLSAIGQKLLHGQHSVTVGPVTSVYSFTLASGDTEITQRSLVLTQSVDTGNFSESSVVLDPITYDDGLWHHFAVVRRGGMFEVYFDGRMVAAVPQAAFNVGNAVGLRYFGGTTLVPLNADWDDIRIWDTARASRDIARSRFTDLPDTTPDLIIYYPFETGMANEGLNVFGNIAPVVALSGALASAEAPVAATHRGTDSLIQTGFQNVGDAWEMVELQGIIPETAHSMQVTFEGQADTGPATGALLDSLFGTFVDASGTAQMPNMDETGTHWKRAGMVTSSTGSRVFQASINEPRAVDGWFNGGLVTFYTGKNAGGSMEVKTWYTATGQLELFLSMPHPIEPGDLFTVYPGCDKSRICCAVFFDNIENMFATPDIPGEDELFRYPDAK